MKRTDRSIIQELLQNEGKREVAGKRVVVVVAVAESRTALVAESQAIRQCVKH